MGRGESKHASQWTVVIGHVTSPTTRRYTKARLYATTPEEAIVHAAASLGIPYHTMTTANAQRAYLPPTPPGVPE